MFSIALMIAMVGDMAIAREYSEEEKQEIRERAREERIELEEKELDRLLRRAQGLPSNPNETPASPKVIYHDEDGRRGVLKGRSRKIEEARIFFDKDASGKPYYRSIAEHFEKNPKFKEV